MTLVEAKAYKTELKNAGRKDGKEYGKLIDYMKTITPNAEERYGKEDLGSSYEKLSSGVTTLGGWTEDNLDPIEEYTGHRPSLSAPEGDLQGGLDNYQQGVYNAAGSPELRESISAQLEPTEAELPETLNRVETAENMRAEMGVDDLETSLNDLKAQLEEQYASKRARTQNVESKPFGNMGVIAGRISEIERQETDRIDAIGRQLNVVNDQLTTAYNGISTMINYMGLDYQDAKSAWESEYNRNLQIYKLVDEELDEQKAAARANLQTYMNAVLSGNISYDNLSGSEKTMINKLELQSGLPIGFIGNLNMSPQDKLISVNDKTGEALFMDANGNFQVVPTGATPTPSGNGGNSTGAFSKQTMDQAESVLKRYDTIVTGGVDRYGNDVAGDKLLSPKEWESAKQAMRDITDSEEEAANLFNRAMSFYGYDRYTGEVNE